MIGYPSGQGGTIVHVRDYPPCPAREILLAEYHNTLLVPPPPKKKIKYCLGIVLDFPWDIFMSQEKLQTVIMQNFGGLKRCIMGFVQVENDQACQVKIT